MLTNQINQQKQNLPTTITITRITRNKISSPKNQTIEQDSIQYKSNNNKIDQYYELD